MTTLIDRYCKALEWLIALLLAAMVLLVNFVVDLAHAAIDPRLRVTSA